MKIEDNKVVYVSMILKNGDGVTLEQSTPEDPVVFVFGQNQILPNIEDELRGKSIGFHLDVTYPPEEAFGEIRKDLLIKEDKSIFGGQALKVGNEWVCEVETDDGMVEADAVIREINDDWVMMDLNHPFAGQTLHYDLTVLNIRDMSAEEIDLGVIQEHQDHYEDE